MACDQTILDAIDNLLKVCSGVGTLLDYEEPTTDLEGLTVMSLRFGRVASAMGETPDNAEITDEASAMGAMVRNIAAIMRHVA